VKDFEDTLAALDRAGLRRSLRMVTPLNGGHVVIDGREFVSFAGNDYLGLRRHPDVCEGASDAMQKYGLGAGASRLLAGTTPIHVALERALAAFTGRERALVFPSGYQTNVGVLTALADEHDVLIVDALCHASLIDAARLAKATMRVYPHAKFTRLRELLERYADRGKRFVVTEGVFSMDGDIAPLAEIARAARDYDAWLILDDAHAFGVLGEGGRGTADHLDVALPQKSLHVATLSKAAGSQGGFVAGDGEVMDVLINRARSFIYSTGLSPACAGGALAGLELFKEGSRRQRLAETATLARKLLREAKADLPEGETPIIPLLIGDVDRTVKLSARLFDEGILAPPIRPPTVPKGTARLRISLSADHTDDDVERLARAVAGAF